VHTPQITGPSSICLGGHVQLAGRLARALDGLAASAALLRLVLALAALAAAAGDEGAVRQEGKARVIDRADDVGVGGGGLAGDPAV